MLLVEARILHLLGRASHRMAKAKHPTFHRTILDVGCNTHGNTHVGIIHMPVCPFAALVGERHTRFDPEMPEWGNPAPVIRCHFEMNT